MADAWLWRIARHRVRVAWYALTVGTVCSRLLTLTALIAAAALAEAAATGPAALTVVADNASGAAVDIVVEGSLAPDAVTGAEVGVTSYATQFSCAAGTGPCGTVSGLHPGAWLHRLSVTVPDADPQVQAQRTVLVAGDPGEGLNALTWTIYARTHVVSTTASDGSPGGLRAALAAAMADTLASGARVLVRFDRDAFPGADDPRTIDLSGACEGGSAALCLTGSHLVIDGLDGDAQPGAVVWSVGTRAVSLLRVTGADNVLRGIVFDGSGADVPDPATCGEDDGGPLQRDTIAIVGAAAQGNTIEESVVLGPTCGDAVSVEQGAAGNVVVATRVTRAQDRGVKVNDGALTIQRSCIHDNDKGGLQSTLGGDVVAVENVLQRNRGGQGQNGITVLDKCRDDNPGCAHVGRSRMVTGGNVVRFSGGRGLSVRDNAEATLGDDYVASNDVKGSEIETTATVPVDENGVERVPVATFHGTAMVCNGSGGNPGVGAETRTELGHQPPDVTYGDATAPGRNAFTSNRNTNAGENFLLTNVPGPVPASGNQWGHCSGTQCDVTNVRSSDLAPVDADVVLGETGTTLEGARTGAPVIDRITPERPRAGDVVRVYGDNFDAINGNPGRDDCDTITPYACSPEGTCPSGPCIDGTCPCAIANPAVQARNEVTPQRPNPPNRIVISRRDGTRLADVAPDAVTPTMLAFHMPVDCVAPLVLRVSKYGQTAEAALCAPAPVTTTSTTTTSVTSSTTTTTSVTSTTTTTPSTSTPPTTSSSSTTTTSSSTSTTMPRVCGLSVPSGQDVDRCARRRLRRRATVLALRIDHALQAGEQPKCGVARRLVRLLQRCSRRSATASQR